MADAAQPVAGRRALAGVAIGLYAAQLAWLAIAAFRPGVLDKAPAWAALLAAPGSLWAMVATLLLGAAAFTLTLFSTGDRAAGTRIPLLVSAWSAASAVPVAFFGYLPCPGDGPPVWDAFNSTISLFLGSFDKPFGPGEVCSYATPVGMHIVRGLALLATTSGATAVMLSLSRSQLDRLAARRARTLTIVTGLDEHSWELVERRTPEHSGHRTALLAAELDQATIERAHTAGMLAVRVEADDPLGQHRGIRLDRVDKVYLLAADDGWNRTRVEHIQKLLAASARTSPLVVVARIDDPWHADEWRKRLVGDPRLAADAVGLYEATSDALILRLRQARPQRLLIVGDAPLTLALSTQLSQLGRELQFLGDEAALPSVTVLAERASELVDDHRVLQRRFAFDPLTIDATDAEPRLAAVLEWLGDGAGCAVVITVPDTRLGTQLGIRLPELPVFEASSSGAAAAETPTVGCLVSFGLSLATPQADAWERAARLIHERYRRRHPGAARAVPWEELPEFYRQSNRRQLGVVRRELTALGRTWRPSSSEPDRFARLDADPRRPVEDGMAVFDLTLEELTQLARAEHDSWLAHYRTAGWTYARTRDDSRRQHPDLVAWEDLPVARQEVDLTGVVDTLFQLRALGHRAVLPASDQAGWRQYRRFGVVTAVRLTAPHDWQTETGETLTGQPGDWLVTDASGQRTVTDPSFRATHLRLDGDRWQRTAEVDARPVRPGERVETQEGATTAGADGWVVRDADGNEWIVPDATFRAGYRLVE